MNRKIVEGSLDISSDKEPKSVGMHVQCDATSSSPDIRVVGVITAVFNGHDHIADCIESVINQDYPNVEHIILDGGSTDGTVTILRSYEGRIAFWKSEPDKGVCDAWNKGLKLARGEWIAFLVRRMFLKLRSRAFQLSRERNWRAT
jgi:cellulose synthase/poly-beta-1,6-N-acetylglucosamine synthase-like glycosyltransferase